MDEAIPREKSHGLDRPIWGAVPIILGFFLSFYRLGFQSLHFDEFCTYYNSNRPLRDIPFNLSDGHPPLYFFLTRAVFLLLRSTNETALRIPSALAGALAVLLGYLVVKKWIDRRAAFWVSLLWALSPFRVYYCHEARQYTLLLLECLLSFYYWSRAVELNRIGDWAVVFVVNLAGLYTHYWYAFFALAQGLWFLWKLRRWRDLFPGAAVLSADALLFLPWIPFIHRQSRVWIPVVERYPPKLTDFFFNAARAFSGTYLNANSFTFSSIIVWTAIACWTGLFAVGAAAGWRDARQRRIIAAGIVLPTACAAITALATRQIILFFHFRYFSIIVPATYLAMAPAFSKRALRALPKIFALVLIVISLSPLNVLFTREIKGDMKALSECIHRGRNPHVPTALLWVNVPSYLWLASSYYFHEKPVLANEESLSKSPFRQAILVGPSADVGRSLKNLGSRWVVDTRCDFHDSAAVSVERLDDPNRNYSGSGKKSHWP